MSDYRDRHTPIPAGVTAAPDNDDRSSVLTFNPILEANRQPINPDNITTDAPEEPFRLGYIDVICLVLNRMIGSGIFMTPMKIAIGTRSTGAVLLFWFAGVLYALAGMHVYIEFGLNVPRFFYKGRERSVARSGGELNYLQYVYRWLGYRGQMVLPITYLFSTAFLAFGNMAGNAINFAIWIGNAADTQMSDAAIRGIAISAGILSCCIHATSRQGGIFINNVIAITKVFVLLLIVITGIVAWAGGFPRTTSVIAQNTSSQTAFAGASQDAHGYADAFLAIVFTFSGFEQPNYVLGEIGRPRRRFPISMVIGVALTSILYMLVNIAYMVVVPKEDQLTHNVAQRFFELTFGQLSTGNNVGFRVFSAFVAISSLGNIIVMTYTAARVKQEIGKQGILLGWSRFFARDHDVSVGRLLAWFKKRGWFDSLLSHRWFSPAAHSEKTPVGALFVHCLGCVLLVAATSGLSPSNAYSLLTLLAAYLLNGCVGFLLGLGILLLRFKKPPQTQDAPPPDLSWTEMTGPSIWPSVSIIAALVYMIGNAYPVIVTWIPPSSAFVSTLQWYLVPAISWATIAVGVFWFLGFLAYARRLRRKNSWLYSVDRTPVFEGSEDPADSDGDANDKDLVMAHETVSLGWEVEVSRESGRDRGNGFNPRERTPWQRGPGWS